MSSEFTFGDNSDEFSIFRESMAVTAWLRSMKRRCYGCWKLVCTWEPERLEQIVDIPVPQIEEEIAEVNRFLQCVKQYLEPLL